MMVTKVIIITVLAALLFTEGSGLKYGLYKNLDETERGNNITTPAITSSNTRLVNNGRTLEMEFLTPVGATMSGGPLAATFRLVGAHFHWGVSSCLGSEHTLNGVRSVVFCDVEK